MRARVTGLFRRGESIRAVRVAGTVATVAALAAAVILTWIGLRGGDGPAGDEDSSPAATAPGVTLPAATATGDAERASATPMVKDIRRESVARGGAVEADWALVIGNAFTGGAEVWLMPEHSMPAGISPSGRYFAWGDSLFDGWTGERTVVNRASDAIVLASYAPDEAHVYIQNAGGEGRLLTLGGVELARLPQAVVMSGEASLLDVVWSPDSRGLAVQRFASGTSRVDVVVDGVLRPALASNGMPGWSNSGLRLAVPGENPAVYDFETSSVVPLERGGLYPSWSADDEWLAVDISKDGSVGLSAIATRSGKEVLRVHNASACFDIDWRGPILVAGLSGSGVRIPSGAIESLPRDDPPEAFLRRESDGGIMRWLRGDDVYAEVRVDGLWAASTSWLRRDVDQLFPPVFVLGLGGKGFCMGQGPEIRVAMPPFPR